jgi:hypothetical protein
MSAIGPKRTFYDCGLESGQKDRLPVLASDLIDNLHVAVLAATTACPASW